MFSQIDMVEIKEEYKKQFNVTLADDIKKNYTGNTSKILLGLIKGMSSFQSIEYYSYNFLY